MPIYRGKWRDMVKFHLNVCIKNCKFVCFKENFRRPNECCDVNIEVLITLFSVEFCQTE